MKKILSFMMVAVLALALAGCDKYDDSELQRRVGELEKSMTQLLNYQALLQKLSAGNTVTSYATTSDGYKLTFSDGKSIEFSAKGPKGDPGDPGDPGTPGKDGKTPQFKIENETWKVSYDGTTWDNVGSAIDRSLIKDIKPNDAGDTLLITLADGTVIPVVYGEKEKFGFEIASGRRCFSVLESLETIQSRTLTIPYVLTGDIKNPDDVEIETRVSSYHDIVSGYNHIKVQKTDAKSGNLRVQMGWDNEGAKWDGGEFYYEYPELVLDVTAHFPDGTSSYKKLYIIGYQFYMETDEDQWEYAYVTDYDPVAKMPAIHLPREAGEFTMIMRVGTTSYSSEYFLPYYDGTPFKTYPFADVFYEVRREADNNGYFVSVAENQEATVVGDTNWWGAEYRVQIKYTRNALGKERYNNLQFWKRESATSAGGLTRIRVYQAAE
ncbi:MAG: hypothetical protein J5693_03395 [Bacteroidales bacterium]|nr:hypothetical protein [Bacteroidales bacterium]